MFRKRISGIMVLIAIGFTACGDSSGDDSSAEYGWYGNGSKNSFTIRNFTQLEGLAKIVKGQTGYDGPAQSDFTGKTVTLTADIDMRGKSWYGIGYSYLPLYPFNGTFDGNNKTISGLYTGNQGFFGLIGENGIIKNLIFVDLSVDGSDGGGGVARTNSGRIQNISVINGYVSGIPGGVVAFNSGIVENCNFSGSIYGSGGGIAETNYTSGVIRNCYVTGSVTGDSGGGGIVESNSGIVQNCYTICSVYGGTFIGHDTGGIAGSNSGTVKDCYATGDVTGTWRVGGVVGSNGSSYDSGIVQNCYATGTVTGDTYVGGIVGYNNGTVQNCVALNPSITASSSTGTQTGRVGNSSTFLNNYGSKGMTLPSSVTVTSNASGIHGADVEASNYNNQTWWVTIVYWDFYTIWEWDSIRNLPKLRISDTFMFQLYTPVHN